MSVAIIMNVKPVTYYGIYRCSTEEKKQQYGILAQKTEVENVVKMKGGILLDECLEERISGCSLEEDRERLIESLEYCKSQGYVAIVAKLDRIARREDLLHNLVRKYPIHFCDIDSGDPLHISVAAAIAAFESRRIKDRSIRGQKESEKKNNIRNGSARTHLVSVSPRSFGRKLKPPVPLSPEAIAKGFPLAAKVNRRKHLERWQPIGRYLIPLYEMKLTYSKIAEVLNDGSYAVLLKLSDKPRKPLTTPAMPPSKKQQLAGITESTPGTKFTKCTVWRGLGILGVLKKKKK
jgi:DNA invertase Pin-like site-specific DNA recombinase